MKNYYCGIGREVPCLFTAPSRVTTLLWNEQLITVIMSAMATQVTSLTIVYSTVYSGPDQRKHQSSAPLAFVRGIHRWPVNSPHKGPVTRKMFPFNDVIMLAVSSNLVEKQAILEKYLPFKHMSILIIPFSHHVIRVLFVAFCVNLP